VESVRRSGVHVALRSSRTPRAVSPGDHRSAYNPRVLVNDLDPAASTLTATSHYFLVCTLCGARQRDDGLVLECEVAHPPALLRTEYKQQNFIPRLNKTGLSRYQEWLPSPRLRDDVGRAVVYRSSGLGNALRLPNLWIAFNGYWPERGADLETATFKELEAGAVLGRLPESGVSLVVASSGNTGAAFAWACSRAESPCLIVVPERGLARFRFRGRLHPSVRIISIEGDYSDALTLAATIAQIPPFHAEGGIKNVARRDGLGAVLLSAYDEMRYLPTHYFQAVGSGTGAVAAHEAAKRICAGRPDLARPRLMMCQNWPFAPIYTAWRQGVTSEESALREVSARVYADELTNSAPPYEVEGGVYDSLVESAGDVLIADNDSVQRAMGMFEELEGIDIEPAAGVAVACLHDAVRQRRIDGDSVVLLNVTGGGRKRLASQYLLEQAVPQWRIPRQLLHNDETFRALAEEVTDAGDGG
jgi:cysteate synthase